MKIVAVSPHLDDAALSASASLAGRGATVVTAFTALPPPDLLVTSWDRMTGATSSLKRQQDRLAEDALAMRLLGAQGVHLDEPEVLYRDSDPDTGRLAACMAEEFARFDEVWLPSAIGGHRDHLFAREAGLRAAADAGFGQVVLYADFPYVIAYGWPSWVSGAPADPHLDAGSWLSDQLDAAGLDESALTARVVRLDAEQRRVKTAIIAAYGTQAAALGLTQHDIARDPAKLDFELYWRAQLKSIAAPG